MELSGSIPPALAHHPGAVPVPPALVSTCKKPHKEATIENSPQQAANSFTITTLIRR
jgi:hypothetical protein